MVANGVPFSLSCRLKSYVTSPHLEFFLEIWLTWAPNHTNIQEGGPIGLIQNGDIINIDIQKRRIDVQLTDEEMEERQRKWTPPPYKVNRGVLYKVIPNHTIFYLLI